MCVRACLRIEEICSYCGSRRPVCVVWLGLRWRGGTQSVVLIRNIESGSINALLGRRIDSFGEIKKNMQITWLCSFNLAPSNW